MRARCLSTGPSRALPDLLGQVVRCDRTPLNGMWVDIDGTRRYKLCLFKMAKHPGHRDRQQDLPFRTHGGARKNAGRKRKAPRRRVAHVTRKTTCARYPVHVTVRVRSEVARLRNFELCKVLRLAFVRGCSRDGFRICQFSV